MKARFWLRATDSVIVLCFCATALRLGYTHLGLGAKLAAPTPDVSEARQLIEPGELLGPLNGAPSDHLRSIVLVVSTSCPACNESVGFYRQLATERTAANAVLNVVSPEPSERIANWLKANLIASDHIIQVTRPLELGLLEAPMVILSDSLGVVTDVLSRQLSSDQEQSLLDRVRDASQTPLNNSSNVRVIGDEELNSLRTRKHVTAIDIRSRDDFDKEHKRDFINIPHDELTTRARAEFQVHDTIVVDVSRGTTHEGISAARDLRFQGFSSVFAYRH